MKLKVIGILLFLIGIIPLEGLYAQTLNSVQGDYEALMALYNSTNGDNWKNNNGWGGDPSTMGDWYGVETDSDGRVISIKLNGNPEIGEEGVVGGNNLRGFLPPEIGNLTRCKYFNVKQNQLTGSIPVEIGNMVSLTHLLLNGRVTDMNEYDSQHPGKPPGGSWADERSNNFTGFLPESIGNLVNLEWLELNGTGTPGDGIEGAIPTSIGNLSKLKGLHLDFNRINSLPSSLGNLTNLIHLALGHQGDENRALEGHGFPQWLGDLVNLKEFWFERNVDIGGSLPDLSKLTKLQVFLVDFNGLTGSIPSVFTDGTMPDISMVQLAWNNFSGSFPEITYYNRLAAFTVPGNNLTGPIPSSWSNFRMGYLQNFSFGWNNLEGELPDFDNMPNLRFIYANNNNFTGSLPLLDTSNDNLKWARFENNKLSGYIDPSLAELGNLPNMDSGDFDISGNAFSQSDMQDLIAAMEADGNLHVLNYSNQDPSGGGETNDPPATPSLSTPSDGATGISTSPTLDWDPASGADTYQVQVAGSSDFSSIVAEQSGLTASQYQAGGLANSTTYWWRVRAANEYGSSSWSAGWAFTTAGSDGDGGGGGSTLPAPGQQSPTDGAGATSLAPTFGWAAVSGADSYILHVSARDPGEMVIDVEISGTSYTPSGSLDPERIHDWRVRAVQDGVEGEWSPIWTFTTGSEEGGASPPPAPVPASPSDGATGISTSPTLDWDPASGADTYRLQVAADQNFLSLEFGGNEISGTQQQLSGLANSTTYWWRVQALNPAGGSNWSEVWSFTTADKENSGNGPNPPGQSKPGDKEKNVPRKPKFEWSSVDADYYRLEVSTVSTGEIILEEDVDDTLFTPEQELAYNTDYRWRIKGIKNEIEGAWSELWTFTTEAEAEGDGGVTDPPGIPVLVTPSDGSRNTALMPTFTWEAVDADHYVLQITNSETSDTVVETEVTGTSYTPAEELAYQTGYRWRVRAVREGVEGDWSTGWRFVTGTPEGIETTLDQNYPNPFNPSTQIRFTLAETQEVSLKVYDTTGRQVATIVEGRLQAGTYERTFRADNLASGVYFLRLVTDTRIATSQMTLLK